MDKNDIIEELKKTLNKSYSPYSKIKVAAATVFEVDGKEEVVFGTNIENISYGLTICAERSSIFNARIKGMEQVKEIYVMSNLDKPIMPCGACRQVISEFARKPDEVLVYCYNERGEEVKFKFNQLLPNSFK